MVKRRILSEATVGSATLKAPVPVLPVSMYATSVDETAVDFVVFTIVNGVAGSSELVVAPL